MDKPSIQIILTERELLLVIAALGLASQNAVSEILMGDYIDLRYKLYNELMSIQQNLLPENTAKGKEA